MDTGSSPVGRVALLRCLGACLAAVTLGLVGCATTPKVQSEHDNSAKFARYKTIAVLEPRASGSATDPGTVMRLTQPALQAVREAMTAKGLTEAPREKADCAVRVVGQSVSSVQVTDWGYNSYPYGVRRAGWGYSPGYSNIDVREITERTLSVEIFDNASKNQVWVGWSQHSGSGQVDPEKLKEAIRNVLAQFPPGAMSQ